MPQQVVHQPHRVAGVGATISEAARKRRRRLRNVWDCLSRVGPVKYIPIPKALCKVVAPNFI